MLSLDKFIESAMLRDLSLLSSKEMITYFFLSFQKTALKLPFFESIALYVIVIIVFKKAV